MCPGFDIDRLPRSVWDRQFRLGATISVGWYWTACQLKRSADLVFGASEEARRKEVEQALQEARLGFRGGSRDMTQEEVALMLDASLIGVSFMLAGLAVENMAKAILAVRDPNCFDSQGRFKRKSHDLEQLVGTDCGVVLDAREVDVLRNLQVHVKWRGRYPIPLEASALYPRRDASGTRWLQPGRDQASMDYTTVGSVYNKLAEIYHTEKQRP